MIVLMVPGLTDFQVDTLVIVVSFLWVCLCSCQSWENWKGR